MLGGLFAGAAAEATDRSMREWRDLFDRRQLQERNLDIQEAQLEWEQERAKILDAYNKGVHDDNMNLHFINTTFESWENMTVDGRAAAIQQFRDLAQVNPVFATYAGTLESMFSRGITVDPMQGMEILQAVQNAEPGSLPYPTFMVEMAAKSVANSLSMEGAERDSFIKSNMDWANELAANRDVIHEQTRQAAINENLKATAYIQNMESQTRYQDVQAEFATQQMQQEAEKHPFIIEGLSLQNESTRLQNFEQNWRNGILDEQWELNQRKLLADIANVEGANKLFNATFDEQVRQMAAKTQMLESEARVAIATENSRIMVENGQWDLLQAQIDKLRQDTATAQAQEQFISGQTAMLSVEELSMRSSILSDLVASGNVEMLQKFAPDLLGDWATEEEAELIISSLTEIAGKIRDRDMAKAASEAVVATVEADYYERQKAAEVQALEADAQVAQNVAETWYEELERRRDLDERRMRVEEGHLKLGEDRLAWDKEKFWAEMDEKRNSRLGQSLRGGDLIDLLDDIQNATSWDSVKITNEQNAILDLEEEYQQLLSLSSGGGNLMAHPLGQKYGLMTPADAAFQAQLLEAKIEARRENLVNGVYQVFTLAASRGHPLQPEDIGLDPDSPYFQRALGRSGLHTLDSIHTGDGIEVNVETLSDAVIRDQPKIAADIDSYLASQADLLAADLTGGTAGLLSVLRNKYGEHVLKELGINSATALRSYMEPLIQERNQHAGAAAMALAHYGDGDLTDINSRQDLIIRTQTDIDTLTELRAQVEAMRPDVTHLGVNWGTQLSDAASQIEPLLPQGISARKGWGPFSNVTKESLLSGIDQALIALTQMQSGVIYFNHHTPPR